MLLKKFAALFRDKRKLTLPQSPLRCPKDNRGKPPQELRVSGLLRLWPLPLPLPLRLPPLLHHQRSQNRLLLRRPPLLHKLRRFLRLQCQSLLLQPLRRNQRHRLHRSLPQRRRLSPLRQRLAL